MSASLRFATGNLRCSVQPGSRANSLHDVPLKQARALIRLALRSSAQTQGLGADSRTAKYRDTEIHKDTPWRVLVCIVFLSSLSLVPVPAPDSPVLAGPVMGPKNGIRAALV